MKCGNGSKLPQAGSRAVHLVEDLVDAVGGEGGVDGGRRAGGQLGVDPVDQRLVRLTAVA